MFTFPWSLELSAFWNCTMSEYYCTIFEKWESTIGMFPVSLQPNNWWQTFQDEQVDYTLISGYVYILCYWSYPGFKIALLRNTAFSCVSCQLSALVQCFGESMTASITMPNIDLLINESMFYMSMAFDFTAITWLLRNGHVHGKLFVVEQLFHVLCTKYLPSCTL